MDRSLCKLTIVCPPLTDERIAEVLCDEGIGNCGFTSIPAEGHGQSFATASASERVRGRVRRTMIIVVIPSARVDLVLAEIAARTPVEHIVYWTEPVAGFGRLELRPVGDGQGEAEASARPGDALR